jgi:N-acetylmuramoyl-L-alanine amidase
MVKVVLEPDGLFNLSDFFKIAISGMTIVTKDKHLLNNIVKLMMGLLACIIFPGCFGSSKLKLHEWENLPKEHYAIPHYARHLSKYKIALDPGHGGNAGLGDYKRGPGGKREAVMNLNVAFRLREFLEAAGAKTFLTREDDRFISLQRRIELADSAGCDFLLSLHHNQSQNPQTNYTAVFYHLTPDHSPFSMDLARNIYFGLVEALRLPQTLDDGLLTDRLIYPAGFGLLRRATLPAILLESSFYSNAREEKRLTELKYNRREAYGIFLGLARWAAGGVPTAGKEAPTRISHAKQPVLRYSLSDGISEKVGRNMGEKLIYSGTVAARIDDKPVSVQVDSGKSVAFFKPDSALSNGVHRIEVQLQNMFKNHNYPRIDTLIVASPTDSVSIQPWLFELPADTAAMIPITLKLFDADGEPVWDGTTVDVSVSKGVVAPANPRLEGGQTTIYYRADNDTGTVDVVVEADSHTDSLHIRLIPPGNVWLIAGGVVDDLTSSPVAAPVFLNDSLVTTTDRNGVFVLKNPAVGYRTFDIRTHGYAGHPTGVLVDSSRSALVNFALAAHFDAILHDVTIILDPAADGLTNEAHLSLDITKALADTLRWAGAHPVLIRQDSVAIPSETRVEIINAIPEGWYLKIGAHRWVDDSTHVTATIYPANKNGEVISRAIIDSFSEFSGFGSELRQNMDVPEVTLTNKTAVEIIIRTNDFAEVSARLFGAILLYYNQNQN